MSFYSSARIASAAFYFYFAFFFLEWYICIYVAMHTRTTFRFLILFFGFFICVLLTNLIQIFRWIHMQPG